MKLPIDRWDSKHKVGLRLKSGGSSAIRYRRAWYELAVTRTNAIICGSCCIATPSDCFHATFKRLSRLRSMLNSSPSNRSRTSSKLKLF